LIPPETLRGFRDHIVEVKARVGSRTITKRGVMGPLGLKAIHITDPITGANYRIVRENIVEIREAP
jgi:hypothetical protein